jgi:hypothetical protein
MDGETRDTPTPMQEADRDAEMTPSEVGTKILISETLWKGKG